MFNKKFYTFDILRVSPRFAVIKNELYSTLTTESGGTVFALSSGIGRCGVAVVRVSGPATALAIRLLSKPTARQPKPRVATLTRFYDPCTRQQIDQGILLWFPSKSIMPHPSALIFCVFIVINSFVWMTFVLFLGFRNSIVLKVW